MLMVGDWNCDLLRGIDLGPYEFRQDEANWEERMRMDAVKSLAVELHVEIQAPQEVISAAGGPWGDLSSVVQVTRIPGGEHSAYISPTCLDWVMCEAGKMLKFEVHWRATPGDHAICLMECEWNIVQQPRPKKFVVNDWDTTVDWLRSELDTMTADLTYDAPVTLLKRMAEQCEDTATCAERRMAKIPFEVRQLWRRACDLRQEHE